MMYGQSINLKRNRKDNNSVQLNLTLFFRFTENRKEIYDLNSRFADNRIAEIS